MLRADALNLDDDFIGLKAAGLFRVPRTKTFFFVFSLKFCSFFFWPIQCPRVDTFVDFVKNKMAVRRWRLFMAIFKFEEKKNV